MHIYFYVLQILHRTFYCYARLILSQYWIWKKSRFHFLKLWLWYIILLKLGKQRVRVLSSIFIFSIYTYTERKSTEFPKTICKQFSPSKSCIIYLCIYLSTYLFIFTSSSMSVKKHNSLTHFLLSPGGTTLCALLNVNEMTVFKLLLTSLPIISEEKL